MKYKKLSCFWGEYAEVAMTVNGHCKWGLIHKSGAEVIPTKYDSISYVGGDVVFVNIGFKEGRKLQYPGKWGIVDLKNIVIVPFKYSVLYPYENGFASVCIRNKWGVIDWHGSIMIPIKYDFICQTPVEKLYMIELASKFGLISIDGKVVVEPIYDELNCWNQSDPDQYFAVRKNDETFFIDKYGKQKF